MNLYRDFSWFLPVLYFFKVVFHIVFKLVIQNHTDSILKDIGRFLIQIKIKELSTWISLKAGQLNYLDVDYWDPR